MHIHPTVIGALVIAGVFECAGPPVAASDAACDVTAPNGIMAGTSARKDWSYGTPFLSVGPFGLWPNGTVVFRPGGPGFVTRDGGLGMKFGWTRGVPGQLNVSGRRLDGVAPPLTIEVNDGHGDVGFQASYLIFPTPGCWEVTARVGEDVHSRIAFTTNVVKLGDGPGLRRERASR
jgi:hypothetical protein